MIVSGNYQKQFGMENISTFVSNNYQEKWGHSWEAQTCCFGCQSSTSRATVIQITSINRDTTNWRIDEESAHIKKQHRN